MVSDLEVSPICPPSRTVCPASPSLRWVAWASLPHLPRYCAPLRLPAVRLRSLRLRSLPNTLPASWVCVPCGSFVGGSSPPTPGLLVNRYPSSSGRHNKETAGSPKFPSFPSDDMLRSPQTPVVSCCLALTPAGLLPSTRARVSAFSLASTGIILWTTTLLISELHDAAYRLATPGSVQPLTELHAGSLLSGWLGVAQVGLESSDSHPLGNSDLFPDVLLHSLDLGLRLARGAPG
jgi:hypothetical protein